MSGFSIFVRYELWVNVPVTIFVRTVDCGNLPLDVLCEAYDVIKPRFCVDSSERK